MRSLFTVVCTIFWNVVLRLDEQHLGIRVSGGYCQYLSHIIVVNTYLLTGCITHCGSGFGPVRTAVRRCSRLPEPRTRTRHHTPEPNMNQNRTTCSVQAVRGSAIGSGPNGGITTAYVSKLQSQHYFATKTAVEFIGTT